MERVSHFRLTLMELSEIRLRSPSPSHPPHASYMVLPFFNYWIQTAILVDPAHEGVTVTVNLKCTITFKQLQNLFSVTNNIDALCILVTLLMHQYKPRHIIPINIST
jgi:hypothetical protein